MGSIAVQFEDSASYLQPQTYRADCSLEGLISRHAETRPQHPAVCAWDGSLTYEELENVTSRVASRLQAECGVKAGMLVPVCFEKSICAIVAELAILKAGAGFVPIDPAQPLAWVQDIMHQTAATVVVTSTTQVSRLGSLGQQILIISQDSISTSGHEVNGNRSCMDASTRYEPDTPAYVLFTSGSTGKPKGCVVPRRALASTWYHCEQLQIRPDSNVLQFASYCFGVSLIEIYCTLCAGATICIPSEDEKLNNLAGAINDRQVSWALLTPSTVNVLDPQALTTLQTLVLAGEALASQHLERWATRVQLLQAYGLTEWAGICCVSSPLDLQADCRNIGRPTTAHLWLADPSDHTMPAQSGETAELLIAGSSMAHGYLNDADRTAAVFIKPPHWIQALGSDCDFVYRTGDLIQRASDGSLLYIGRKDRQVKIRGKRVQLNEVEQLVHQHCMQSDRIIAEMVAPADDCENPLLTVFIWSKKHADCPEVDQQAPQFAAPSAVFRANATRIKKELETSVLEYMIPRLFVPLKALPLTVTGKVDRRRLAETARRLSRQTLAAYRLHQADVVPPRTEMEKQLHNLFATVLKLRPEEFGIHEPFVALGGDSILAMHMVTLARQRKLTLTIQAILENGTVALLVPRVLREKRARCDDTSIPEPGTSKKRRLEKEEELCDPERMPELLVSEMMEQQLSVLGISLQDDVEDVYPCSPVQEGMLFSQLRSPGLYEMRLVYKITSLDPSHFVDPFRLSRAWADLLTLHPMLRTILIETGGGDILAMQVVLRHGRTDAAIIQCAASEFKDACAVRLSPGRRGRQALPKLTIYSVAEGELYAMIDINHTLLDAISLSIMLRDLTRLYRGVTVSQSPLSYSDYVRYLNQSRGAALNFWTSYLARVKPSVFPQLATKAPEPRRLRSVTVSVEPSKCFQDFCGSTCITMATIFKVAWGLVLRAYIASDDVCFGFMAAGRDIPLEGIENAVGPFINFLVCRLQFTSDMSLLQILQNAQADFLQSLQHRGTSLTEIRHALGMGNGPMLNTGITFPPSQTNDSDECGSQGRIAFHELERIDPSEFDIVVEVCNHDEGVSCILKYWDSCLSEEQAANVASTYSTAVLRILKQTQQTVAELDLCSDHDQGQIAQWNRNTFNVPGQCVHDLIQQRNRTQQDRVAVDAWDGQFTYGQLDELSTQLAYYLRSRGIGPETIVPLCFAKSRWNPIAALGVMKAGGAFGLLDPAHPEQRLQDICAQLGSRLIIASEEFQNLAGHLASEVLVLGNGQAQLWQNTGANPATTPSVSPNNAMFVVFTSGSTGKPKGVVMEHRSFCCAALAALDSIHLSQQSRVLQFSAYSFDVSVLDTMLTFLAGGCLCIPSDLDRRDRLADVINQMRVNWLATTPSVARLLRPDQVPTLETLVLGGEALAPSDIQNWAPHVRLATMYGPAECAVGITVRSHVTVDSVPTGIGRATGAASLWIVDPSDASKLAPIGAIGELIVEGPAVSRGYLNDPDQTTAKFIAPPSWRKSRLFPQPLPKCLYKTGDLARYDADGSMVFLGRKDTQVKLRGHRIELGDVEHHIRQAFSGVDEVIAEVVHARGEDAMDSATLVAFIYFAHEENDQQSNGNSHKESEAPKSDMARIDGSSAMFGHADDDFHARVSSAVTSLDSMLPDYMVPAIFIPLRQRPLSSTGKTDRRLLRELVGAMPRETLDQFHVSQEHRRAPTTPMEVKLQGLFARVLHRPVHRIGAEDDFFRLGGDSLVAMKLVGYARTDGIKFSVADLFKHPKLAELAAAVQSTAEGAAEQRLQPLISNHGLRQRVMTATMAQHDVVEDDILDVYPCTPAQEDLIVTAEHHPGMCISRFECQLRPEVDCDRLRVALEDTIDAHDILRTRIIRCGDDGLFQVVVRRRGRIEWVDRNEADQSLSCPVGLGQPLARWALVRSSKESRTTSLVLLLHSAAYDVWSLHLFFRQLEQAYDGRTSSIEPFHQFVRYILSIDAASSRQFWVSQFDGLRAPVFPSIPQGISSVQPTSTFHREIPVSFTKAAGATPAHLVRLAWALVISHFMQYDDVLFGVTVTGRSADLSTIEHIAGPTSATVPCRVRVDKRKTVEAALKVIQDNATSMIPFEQTGLQNIRKMSREAAVACGFQSFVSIQLPVETASRGHLIEQMRTADSEYTFASYALNVVCQLRAKNDGFSTSVRFDPRIISREQVGSIMERFCHVLHQICADTTSIIGDWDASS